MKVLRPSLPPEIFLKRDFMLSVLEEHLHEKLFGSPRKPSGEPPQMLPLCTPEYRQGHRQLLPFLLSKPFNKFKAKSENLRSNFSGKNPRKMACTIGFEPIRRLSPTTIGFQDQPLTRLGLSADWAVVSDSNRF